MEIWNNPLLLENLERKREEKKRSDRLFQSFECFNLKCKENHCYCSLGKRLHNTSKDGTIDLRSVLRGLSPRVCVNCVSKNLEVGEKDPLQETLEKVK